MPAFNLALLEQSMEGNVASVREVVRLFLNDCPLQMAGLERAVAERDAARVRTIAHTLKGAAEYLCATLVVEAARELEEIGREGSLERAEAVYRRLDAEMTRVMEGLRRLHGQPA